ncbi:TPA_asm: host specificity protein J [Salmonella enterica subsp. enterica serovar Java]|nr:host specificity protein J [Salmonella enterica subsp. enterica serovar Java]
MGGKSGGSSRTPREAPDNLKSNQLLTVIDAISEGPIAGPVEGMQSVLVNKTPVTDSAGNPNIHGVTVTYRVGEQEQTAMEGFEESGAETLLNVEITKNEPVTRTITARTIDRLRFTFGVQSLVSTSSKADRNPSSVQLQIYIRRDGAWTLEKDITINGKTTTQYLTSVVVDNLPARPFDIRMVRVTPDSNTDQLQNKTVWSGYTEIIDVKQRYPNTAVVGLQVDAEQFGSQQVSRNYHMYGRIVQVPSNYNPVTRVYTGLWDGTYKPGYTSNPAWCVLDLLTHPRYGMGGRIGIADVDKWALYAIAQYCDQSVPDGFGGTEPRITCNAYLTEQRKAWDVLSDFCSLMRCMPVWNGSTLTFVQDRPSDKVWTYTQGNVVMPDDGAPFRYSFSALKDRHNAVEVRYIDPKNGWETSTELVENDAAIRRYGRNVLKMDAFACTSRGQAHRAGLWVITTELLETQTVDFAVGAEGLRHVPGDIIEICDSDYAGISIGGRILSVDTATRTLTLDRNVELPAKGGAMLNLIAGNGEPVSASITGHPSPEKVILGQLPAGIAQYSVWGLKLPDLRQRLFRCIAIRENDDGTYAITAVQHVPEKSAIVDNGARFDPLPGTVNGQTPPPVQYLTTEILPDGDRYQVEAAWSTPRVVKGVNFLLRLTVLADDNSERLASSITVTDTHYRFHNLTPGRYTLTVRAVNSAGQLGDPASTVFSIAAPAAPSYVELTTGYFQITATPRQAVYDPTVLYEFWYSDKKITSSSQIESTAHYLGSALYWIISGVNIAPGKDHFIYVRSKNSVGVSAFVEAVGRASDDADGYLNFFKGQIEQTHLAQSLFSQIDNSLLEPDLAEIRQSVTATKNEIEQVVNKELDNQAATIQQLQQVQKDTDGKLRSMWSVKLQQMSNGQYVIAGLGVGIENTPAGMQSQILMMADRIAMVNPANGNTQPLFVAQGNQLFIGESFIKSVNVNGRFIVTSNGDLTVRASPTSNAGMRMNNALLQVNDDSGNWVIKIGDLWQTL